jgi:hypothetical protein
MLTHTQSLRSLTLRCPGGRQEDIALAKTRSGLKKNTTLRELTLEIARSATTVSPTFTCLRDHPLLRRLCVRGNVVDLTGLATALQSDTSKIKELEIYKYYKGQPIIMGLAQMLRALARRPALTKLRLIDLRLGPDAARLLRMVLCKNPSLESLDLARNGLGSAGLAELAPSLYRNTSIKVLDISHNNLFDMESAGILRDIIRSNKTITALALSKNTFGRTTGAVEYCRGAGQQLNATEDRPFRLCLARCPHLNSGGNSRLRDHDAAETHTWYEFHDI